MVPHIPLTRRRRPPCRHAARRRLLSVSGAVVLGLWSPARVGAQTDYYNTDAGRPVTVEDAYPTERYGFELQLAPLRLERARGGRYTWGVEPELAYGIFPRTQLEVGVPIAYRDLGAGQRRVGVTGLDVSLLHNLNAETRTLPAFGIAAEVLAPVGSMAPDRAYFTAKGIATRTYRWARFHVNAQYTAGSAPSEAAGTGAPTAPSAGAIELSRWLGGIAVDRTWPLRSLLLTAETYARRPMTDGEPVEWNVGTGVRYQMTPVFALDAGVGKRLTGDDRAWFVTFGLARAFAIRALMPR